MDYREKEINEGLKLLMDFRKEASDLYHDSIKNLGLAYFSTIANLRDLSFDKTILKAYFFAKKAAGFLRYDINHEPSRSIHYFTACALAINLKKYDEAKQLFSEMCASDKKLKLFTDDLKIMFEQNNIKY